MASTHPAFADNDAKKFSNDARRVIAFARILGWEVKWGNQAKRMAILTSPAGMPHKEINIPTTNINTNRIRSWVNQITTYSDPMAVSNLVAGGAGIDLTKEPDIARLVATYGTQLVEMYGEMKEREEQKALAVVREAEQATVGRLPETEAEREVVKRHKTAVAQAMEQAEENKAEREAKVIEMPKPVTPSNDERVPVSVRPWLAKASGSKGSHGKLYESRGVMIATFADGTETYQCRFCTYMNDNPRSVKMHAANQHRDKPKEERVLLETDHYEPSDIKHPHQQAVRKLRNDIIAALDGIEGWQQMDVTDLALTMAQTIVDNRPERAATEPLTDEQVLRRIEALVDRGRVAELDRQVSSLAEELRLVTQAREEAEARADKATGNLQALREMLSEES